MVTAETTPVDTQLTVGFENISNTGVHHAFTVEFRSAEERFALFIERPSKTRHVYHLAIATLGEYAKVPPTTISGYDNLRKVVGPPFEVGTSLSFDVRASSAVIVQIALNELAVFPDRLQTICKVIIDEVSQGTSLVSLHEALNANREDLQQFGANIEGLVQLALLAQAESMPPTLDLEP